MVTEVENEAPMTDFESIAGVGKRGLERLNAALQEQGMDLHGAPAPEDRSATFTRGHTGKNSEDMAGAKISLYGLPHDEDLLEHLGKHTVSKSCLYINKPEDVDLQVLEELIRRGWDSAPAGCWKAALVEEPGDGVWVGVGKQLAETVILVLFTNGLRCVREGSNGAQDALVRFVLERNRTPALPAIAAQAVKAAVVARAGISISGDVGSRHGLILAQARELLLGEQSPQQRGVGVFYNAGL